MATQNPFGNGSGGTRSALQTATTEAPAQKSADSETCINPQSVPKGGKDAKNDPGATKTERFASDTSGVSGGKPFRVSK